MPIESQAVAAPDSSAKPATDFKLSNVVLFGNKGPGLRERMIFTEQLALLLETDMPLHAALESMLEQCDHPGMAGMLKSILDDVKTGQRFSAALSQHPEFFSPTYVNIVGASEDSGFLHKALLHLQADEEKRDELRKTLKSALSYPLFLVGFSVLVVLFVLIGVFPKFAEMFERIRDQLPVTTLVLMWCSDALRAFWWQILLTVGGIGALLFRWAGSAGGKRTLDRWKLSLPAIKDVFIQLYITQSFRVMSLSLNQGVSVVDALAGIRNVVDNQIYTGLMAQVEQSVQDGGKIATPFANSPLIPGLVKQMVATAETSGNLPLVFGRIADHYERELKRRLDALSKMAEPVMLLVMGLVVGLIVSSLILPIFKLSKAIS